MSTKTTYISDNVFRVLPRELRKDLLTHLRRDCIVGNYAANVASALYVRGEGELATEFLDELNYLPVPLRVR